MMRMQLAQEIVIRREPPVKRMRQKLCDKRYLTTDSKTVLLDLQLEINKADRLLKTKF
tara:strand:- start:534 stop:707 length:174 start_codon:yes stop_codon:yes gene_type:complete